MDPRITALNSATSVALAPPVHAQRVATGRDEVAKIRVVGQPRPDARDQAACTGRATEPSLRRAVGAIRRIPEGTLPKPDQPDVRPLTRRIQMPYVRREVL
jgi:hypothetical protein